MEGDFRQNAMHGSPKSHLDMEDLRFPEMNAGILASFQAVMENIAKSRLRDTFPIPGLNRDTGLKTTDAADDCPNDISHLTYLPARQSSVSQNRLSMGIVGCLPDNVQKATWSFSIKPGKQHFTIAFPFMADMVRSCPTDNDFQLSDAASQLSEALYIDMGPEVISGFRSLSTLMMNKQRTSLLVVLLTLFEVNSMEGILRHFDSMVRMLVHPNTPITLWKHPLCVLDLDSRVKEAICSASAETILEIQHENIQNSFPGKGRRELHKYLKEQVIEPRFRSYNQHFYRTSKGLSGSTVLSDNGHIVTMLEQLRWGQCSATDFQKVDAYLKASSSSLVRTFWLVWGHDQLASKIFPVAKAAREPRFFHSSNHSASSVLSDSRVSVAYVSIKEGLKNIIDSLKQQESHGKTGAPDGVERNAACPCCSHVESTTVSSFTSPSINKSVREQSAFYRPKSSRRIRQSTTPYSDALKAVAVSPYNCKKLLTYGKKEISLEGINRQSSLLNRRTCYPQKIPHLHSLYCDFFGTKINTPASTEPSSTTSL